VNTLTKQPTSAMCFVCGRENPVGLHVHFFADEQNRVHAEFTPRAEHQGFPSVMHGGLISTLLDETIGRTAVANDFWCVTAELTVRYKKPVPIGEPLRLLGEIVNQDARTLKGRAEIRSVRDNTLLAEAEGVYIRISDERRRAMETNTLLGWRVED
jgi:acyl-coenzyme A thioesterase PaaI-like protein